MSNITYNGVPKIVIKQAFQCKKQIEKIVTVNLLNLGSAALLNEYTELQQWVLENPKGEAELFEAMERYVSGNLPDKK